MWRANIILATADGCGTAEILNAVDAPTPKRKAIHAIVDNYVTHKHPKVREWLTKHLPWTFHFTPTSASWLNAVEGFLAKLTRRRLKRGVFRSVVDIKAAINRFIVEANSDPKPFVWTVDPNRVLAAVKRGKQALESVHQGTVSLSPSSAWPMARSRPAIIAIGAASSSSAS